MRYRLKCPANRYVFKSRLNCSESTAVSSRDAVQQQRMIDRQDSSWNLARIVCVCLCSRLASSTSSSSLDGTAMPLNKRLQPCGPPSPAGLPHRSLYAPGPPGRDQPPAVARYSLPMAPVPASYDAAAAVAAAFHTQPYPPVSIPELLACCWHGGGLPKQWSLRPVGLVAWKGVVDFNTLR